MSPQDTRRAIGELEQDIKALKAKHKATLQRLQLGGSYPVSHEAYFVLQLLNDIEHTIHFMDPTDGTSL